MYSTGPKVSVGGCARIVFLYGKAQARTETFGAVLHTVLLHIHYGITYLHSERRIQASGALCIPQQNLYVMVLCQVLEILILYLLVHGRKYSRRAATVARATPYFVPIEPTRSDSNVRRSLVSMHARPVSAMRTVGTISLFLLHSFHCLP